MIKLPNANTIVINYIAQKNLDANKVSKSCLEGRSYTSLTILIEEIDS